jgi:hypothetical protein
MRRGEGEIIVIKMLAKLEKYIMIFDRLGLGVSPRGIVPFTV